MTQEETETLIKIESKIMSATEALTLYQKGIEKLKTQYQAEKETRLGVDIAYEISFLVGRVHECEKEIREQKSLLKCYAKTI